ncbi:lipocalin-like domain-containing protein [Planktotalea frisia]|uniref:lipocalin-like domain-containing protein n=1 Tax=Planktotalea frisia TaxID=696762 RepID=UPI002354E6D3|nr:lipocalin-like domain-containing protein [Planktotalea frisia]
MKWLLLILFLPSAAIAQGFAGLGTDIDSFATPERGQALTFPKDHGAHNDYRIEWWYLTANLEGPDGTPYGLQWTLFRSALNPSEGEGWNSAQLWMGHAAVTTPSAHYVTERLGRGGIGQAGVKVDERFEAWIDDWYLRGSTDFNEMELRAVGPDFGYDMTLSAQGPLVLQGDAGYSVKSAAGQASYYYSQPFYDIAGTLALPEGDIAVTGHAWLDREWSSQPLASDQTGWDWFSLSFDSGARMMGFVLRSNETAPYTSATWIDADGTATPMPNGAFQAQEINRTDVAGRSVPTTWAVQLPEKGVDLTVSALNPQAWMTTSVPYWEGPITIEGSHAGTGYLEMTGYE